jgi:hypothetical protein
MRHLNLFDKLNIKVEIQAMWLTGDRLRCWCWWQTRGARWAARWQG